MFHKYVLSRVGSNTRKILGNSSWMLFEQISRMLLGLFVGVLIARHLGPMEFGNLSFLQAYISLFSIISALGLNRIVVRELVNVSGDAEKEKEIIITAFCMRVSAAVVLFVVCVAVGVIFNQSRMDYIFIISFSLFFTPFETFELLFQARTNSRPVACARSIVFFGSAVLKMILLFLGAGLQVFVVMCLVDVILSAVAVKITYKMKWGALYFNQFNFKAAKNMLTESWSEIIAAFSGMLFMRIDQIMLANLAGPDAVGVFSAASKISEMWYFVPVAIVASAFPTIVASREHGDALYWKRLGRLMNALVGLSYVVLIITFSSAAYFIPLVYGADYVESVPVLYIHIWCGLMVCFAQVSGAWLVNEKKIRLNLFRNVLGAVINLVLNFALIPVYGPVGAAIATMLSFMFAYFIFDLFYPPMKKMGLLKLRSLLLAA
ncbi:flippase [Plasticicumulans acidivorans]|uniref:O-antigen/teichoic acid export membrane protein n=1 Tax=Plasticicumulans acidivorans TaxID=886464 RepID=A0A317N0I4_9GAMM|nr:flippase [Plasticicumulans acidivorans]PWV65634.1 O-antigen/teichoic acid export membrane protein [Plasticicumulans acidivorans]